MAQQGAMTSEMRPQTEKLAPLSVHHAFVVHLRVNSDIARQHLTGLVEHVVSGQATHFQSLEELLAFMKRVLTQSEKPMKSK